MWQAIICGFFAGLFAANGVPHFVKGITHETYPCMLGNSAVPNLIGGWGSFVVAGVFVYAIDVSQHAATTLVAAAIGALLIGLFHATGLALGRKA